MKKQASFFNPYSLLVLGIFVSYFPAYFLHKARPPSIMLGPVHLYIGDFAFLLLLVYAFVTFVGGGGDRVHTDRRTKTSGRTVQIIFGLFFMYGVIKWLIQGTIDTANIRMALSFIPAYAFLATFPLIIKRKGDLKVQIYLLIAFVLFIFLMHIYAFATEGFKVHILGGKFLSMLSVVYFLSLKENDLLRLSPIMSIVVKGLAVITFLMVGHRSGYIGLLLGLMIYSLFYRKTAVKEISIVVLITVIGAGAAFLVSSKGVEHVEARASTTFSTTNRTYRDRLNDYLWILEEPKEHPWIGKPLVTNETLDWKEIQVTKGNITTSVSKDVLTPHDLVLEWLVYYGWIGVFLGSALMIAAFRFIKRFLHRHKDDVRSYRIGVAAVCAMAHNVFFALTNVTAMSVSSTYFLYFPLAMLMVVDRIGA